MAIAEVGCDRGPKIGPPQKLSKKGDAQTAEVGTAVATAPSLQIVDANGRGVPGLAVVFSVTSGGGSVQTANAQTDKEGIASSGSWTLGTLAGLQSITATASGVPGSPVQFSAMARAGATTALTKVGNEPTSSPAGGNIDSIVVLAADKFGNPVADQTVLFAVKSGGGSVSPASRITLADGRAATRWTLGPDVGAGNTATASRPDGSLQVIFSTLTTNPVAAVRFAEHVIVVDSGSSVSPVIRVLDFGGGNIAGAGVSLASRNLVIATAASSFTGARPGQTFVVATALDNPEARDSAMLVVASAGKPTVTLTVPRFDIKTDTTFTVSLILDSRSTTTPVGSATLQVVWNPAVLTFVSDQPTMLSNVVVDASVNASLGVATMAMASSAGITGAVELRRITFKASSAANRTGILSVDVADIAAAGTFASLAGQTVSGFYPLRTR